MQELFKNGKNVVFSLCFGIPFKEVYYIETKQPGKCFGILVRRKQNFLAFIQLKM